MLLRKLIDQTGSNSRNFNIYNGDCKFAIPNFSARWNSVYTLSRKGDKRWSCVDTGAGVLVAITSTVAMQQHLTSATEAADRTENLREAGSRDSCETR